MISLNCDMTSYLQAIQRCMTVFIKLSMKDRTCIYIKKNPFDNGSGLAVHP